jgi:tryptophanyl-tRNA synthetase
VGLYTYPVLQAADVLLYQATHVPVGEDQKQHIELIRDIALKFNCDYDWSCSRCPSRISARRRRGSCRCATGGAKMSKSDPSDMSRINLIDDSDLIAQKIRKARTDAEPLPDSFEALAGRPEARNLVTIYAAPGRPDAAGGGGGICRPGFGAFKPKLADLLIATMAPIGERLREFRADPAAVDAVLVAGAERAAAAAEPTLAGAYRALGLPSRH